MGLLDHATVPVSEVATLDRVGDFAVIAYSSLRYKSVPHSSITTDLNLAKMWAKTLSVTDDKAVNAYLWDTSLCTDFTTTHITMTGGGGSGGNGETVWGAGGGTYSYKVTSGTAAAPVTGYSLTGTTLTMSGTAGGGGGSSILTYPTVWSSGYSYTESYVVVRISDITSTPKTPPKLELFDGLTREDCLRQFAVNQRSEGLPPYRLTAKQLEIARLEWSQALKRLNEADKESIRLQVLVDLDIDE